MLYIIIKEYFIRTGNKKIFLLCTIPKLSIPKQIVKVDFNIKCSLFPTEVQDFKIATLTYKAVHLKQPPCLAQHLKLKSMHLNTQNSEQLLL